ncbi:MAG: UDP-N-acetylglucosamine 1-carboxyvinyltransferase [Pseudomonadota bacterium]
MSRFVIEGGRRLSGTVRPSGNKNEALPVLMACLLTDQTVTLERVPRIEDVLTVCDILAGMGVKVEWEDKETLHLTARDIHTSTPSASLCAKIRASILLMGPLLARTGRIELPLPGGDVIGARRIDTHWEGIEALGGQLRFHDGKIAGQLKKAKGCEIFMDEPSVTATENLLLLAATAEGTTVLHNAASEPHVTGLCNLLVAMGAEIDGTGTNRLIIEGKKQLHGARHKIGPDFMEVGSMLCLGAIGGGKVRIEEAGVSDLRFVLKTLGRLGIHPTMDGDALEIDGTKPLVVRKEVSGRMPTIYSGPWPAYPTDLMSVAIVAATQSIGTTIFFEKMFEGRMFFTDKLMQMGANIVLCDPHRVVITGPSKLFAARMSSPDVRAGMALLMAAAIAEGKSVIDNIHQIERGYMDIDKKLSSLGASITRES